jgi:hypothetical protein
MTPDGRRPTLPGAAGEVKVFDAGRAHHVSIGRRILAAGVLAG